MAPAEEVQRFAAPSPIRLTTVDSEGLGRRGWRRARRASREALEGRSVPWSPIRGSLERVSRRVAPGTLTGAGAPGGDERQVHPVWPANGPAPPWRSRVSLQPNWLRWRRRAGGHATLVLRSHPLDCWDAHGVPDLSSCCFWTSRVTEGSERSCLSVALGEPLPIYRNPVMASQRHSKKEGSLRDLFAKTSAKEIPPGESLLEEGSDTGDQGERVEGEAPLTRFFMEQLFGALRRDFATLKQKIPAEVKELKCEVVELGQQVGPLEQTRDAREEKLDCHRRELLILHYKNQGLQYQLEDLENRSRRSII
ncbi:hypothetical protein NDU88_004042 [Pleurodeles waltl]|uniref:Uncharacterized protein n=1 Tax=Pleurodeles waltl TaxID=8319 RepID=A0AAV7LK72_PLEWA|nr:hypothetical protein NDU88_004042 [Pleurodeles waltl]